MRGLLSIRRFLAYIVLALWSLCTFTIVGKDVADSVAASWEVREATFQPRSTNDNLNRLEAEVKASKDFLDFVTSRREESTILFRVWFGLTVVGSALFAEKKARP
jgi:hypothetical protein